jgi:hypothetical protein
MPSFGKTITGLEAMSGSLDKVILKAGELAQVAPKIRETVAAAKTEFDELDRLYEHSKARQNAFSRDFELDIEAVRIGAKDLQDLIQKWGDATIITENGVERIRDLFSGADLGQYRQEIQDLISDLDNGAAGLEKVITFLKENAGELASRLIKVLELFRQGKASLEEVQAALDAAKAQFPNSEFGALADEIADQLLGGLL